MGYIIGLIIVLLFVPLLFLMLTRRSTGGGGIGRKDRGVTLDRPSADEPTPRAGPGVDPQIPPA